MRLQRGMHNLRARRTENSAFVDDTNHIDRIGRKTLSKSRLNNGF